MARPRGSSFVRLGIHLAAILAFGVCQAGTFVLPGSVDRCIPLGLPVIAPTRSQTDGATRATVERVLFGWPLAWPYGHPHLRIVDYVDENPTNGLRLDYMGGDYCYDGHNGTDINLNSFRDMDAGVPVLAAANGRVVFVSDSDFDRQVDGPHSVPGNGVVILHEDGVATTYWHLRTNSATVSLGEYVREGQILGMVGSAGTTTNPHLHFEVADWLGFGIVDPWGGSANPLPSRWKAQQPYAGSIPIEIKELAVTTGSEFQNEGNLTSWLAFKNGPSQPVVLGIDEPTLKLWSLVSGTTGTAFTVDVRRPDGSLFSHVSGIMPTRANGQTFQYWDLPFAGNVSPADYGTWTAEAFRDGVSLFRDSFVVGETSRFAPRFQYVEGRSFHLDGGLHEDAPVTSYLGAPAESLTFALENPPGNVSLRIDEAGQPIVSIGAPGPDLANARSREFALVATDPDGREGRMSYHLVNNAASTLGSPPVVSVPTDASVVEGDSVVVDVSASDPDGDAIASLIAGLYILPSGSARFTVSADNAHGRLVWHTNTGDQGDYSVRFTAGTSLGGIPWFGYQPIVQYGEATVRIHVQPALRARAFTTGGDRTLRLKTPKPTWCIQVQGVDGSFDPSRIDPTTIQLISKGTGSVDRISPSMSDLTSRDGATFCFGRPDLENLFSYIAGSRTVNTLVTGRLQQGSPFSAPLEVDLVGDRFLAGGGIVGVRDLNDRGQVAVQMLRADNTFTPHPGIWDKGQALDLGLGSVEPPWLNNRGQAATIERCSNLTYLGIPSVWSKGKIAGPGADACQSFPVIAGFNDSGDLLWSYRSASNSFVPLVSLWQGGTVRNVAFPGGNRGTFGIGLNDFGTALATYYDSTFIQHGFLWENGVTTLLPTVPYPIAINNRRQVLGMAPGFRNVLWEAGNTLELRSLPGDAGAWVYGLNDQGVVSGYSYDSLSTTVQAVIWERGSATPRSLGLLPGHQYSYAIQASRDGTVVGLSYGANERVFVWRAGTLTDIGTLGGENTSGAWINDRDQVLGWSQTLSGGFHFFIWENGVMTDMTTPPGATSQASATSAAALSATGPVLGVTPNPSRGEVSFRLRMPSGESGSLDVFDLAGRRVRHMDLQRDAVGSRVVRWDGRAQDGGAVGAGVYWVRFRTGTREWKQRLVLLK